MDEKKDPIYQSTLKDNWVETKGWAPDLVRRILKRLRRSNPTIPEESKIVVVHSKEINAYAVTGDYIYISRSLIEKCRDEESAAFIIAHELAHKDLGHLEVIPSWAKSIENLPNWLESPFVLTFVVLNIIKTWFTPRVECDADLAGLNFCINSGYDPAKCIALFDILEMEAYNRRCHYAAFGPDDECDDELNENASFGTKFNIWVFYLISRSLPIRDRREYLLQKLEARGIPRDKRRRLAQRI